MWGTAVSVPSQACPPSLAPPSRASFGAPAIALAEAGCSAGQMPLDFHHGLLDRQKDKTPQRPRVIRRARVPLFCVREQAPVAS